MAVGIHILNRNTEEITGYYTNNSKKMMVLSNVHARNRDEHSETFDFTVPYKFLDDFHNQNRVLIPDVRKGEFREFVIKHKETADKEIFIQCDGAWLDDLARNSEPLPPVNLNNVTVDEAVTYALSITGYEKGHIEYDGFIDLVTTEYTRPYDLLLKIEEITDLQFDVTIETSGNEITGRYVHMNVPDDLSEFTGKELVRGKDITTIKQKENTRELATALLITSTDSKGAPLVTKVYNDEARDRWGNNGKFSWDIYNIEANEKSNMTTAKMKTIGARELKKRIEQAVEYEVQAVDIIAQLGITANFGDRVRVRDVTYKPHFYLEATVKAVQRDIFDDNSKELVLGSVKKFSESSLRSYFNSMQSQLTAKMNDSINNVNTIIEQNKIHTGNTPPPDAIDGQLWYDNSVSEVAVLREFKDGGWTNQTPNNVENIGGLKKEKTLYTNLHQIYEDLFVEYSKIQTLVNQLLSNEYLVDTTIKNTLQVAFNNLNGSFLSMKSADSSMTVDTANMTGLNALQLAIGDFRTKVQEINIAQAGAQKAIDDRFGLLQSQYTDEKAGVIMQEVAKATGLVYDPTNNTLTGDVNVSDTEYNRIYDKVTADSVGKYVESGTYSTDKKGLVESIDANKSAIEQTGKSINLEVSDSKLNTQLKTLQEAVSSIKLVADGINITSSADGLISSVSVDPTNIKIKSDIINLIGDVYMQDGLVRVSDLKIGGEDKAGKIEIKNANNEVFFGLDTEQATASELSIGTLRVEKIENKDIVTQSSDNLTFFVSNLGDNENDGLTLETAFATVERALEEVPTVYNGECTIYLRLLESGEIVEVKGYTGEGKITFAGVASTGTPSVGQIRNSVAFKFAGNTIESYLTNLLIETENGTSGVSVSGASVTATNVNINGQGGGEQAVSISRNGYFEWRTGQSNNVARGMTCASGSNAFLKDVTLYANDFGIVSAYASQVECNVVKIKAGTSTNAFEGSLIGGSITNLTTASTVAPAPPPTTKTVTLTSSSAGHYYKSSIGWNGVFMKSYPIQGTWSPYGERMGFWFFGTQFDRFVGKTIKKVRVYIGRSSVNMQGYTGSRKATLRMHTYGTKPSTAPATSNATQSKEIYLAMGDSKWVDVTSVFGSMINQTAWKGFAVNTDSSSAYEYMAMKPTLKVEVTYVV
ncbi:hypothetical protein ACMGE9_12465 [Macrococcus sp. EM39E]|uniref:hypothetical protein n=1 Tax=Macrococcus animalis TaxID=3395467 RepID=UPI0039BDBF8C